jgi:dephospho-CoA kinase
MIIGVTGTLGSGKGTVVDYLVRDKKFRHFSVSGFMKSVAEGRKIAPSRMVYQNIGNEYRSKSPTKLIEDTITYWGGSGESDDYVVESLHTIPEVEYVQSRGGVVIAVDADLPTRYERILKRGSEKDQTTFEEFAEHERAELRSDDPNKNNLTWTMAAADHKIQNNGTLEELYRQVDAVLGASHDAPRAH